jgi:hypothetical protein
MSTNTPEQPDPFALARPDEGVACLPIAELTRRLAETVDAYNLADEQAVAAGRARDIEQEGSHDAEMRRLGKIERKLKRKICKGHPRSADEALMQLVVAAELLDLVVHAGGGRGRCGAPAETAVRSALRFLVPSIGAKLPDRLTCWALCDPDRADVEAAQ